MNREYFEAQSIRVHSPSGFASHRALPALKTSESLQSQESRAACRASTGKANL